MQDPQVAAASTGSFDFASLLASLTAPAKKKAEAWDDSALADDVATISYEKALRTHTRGWGDEATDLHALQTDDCAIRRGNDGVSSAAKREGRLAATVTLRMSKSECMQLRERADEAGLTVSAYLRSCVFEAEALRAQVKAALVRFRSVSAGPDDTEKQAQTRSPSWRTRLFLLWCRGIRNAKR